MTNNPRITNDDLAEYMRNEKLKRQGSEPRQGTTYFQQSLVDLGLENSTGRFTSKPTVTGQTKAVEYPAASSPWSAQADPGLEPSLGYEIDAQEATGTFEEIERSIAQEGDGCMPDCAGEHRYQHGDAPLPSTELTRDVSQPPNHPSNARVSSLTGLEQSRVIPSTNLAGGSDSHQPPVAVGSATVSSPVASQTSPATPSPHPDGLDDCPRRADGTPLSSHTHAPFKKRKV